jgi:hypothetical protein
MPGGIRNVGRSIVPARAPGGGAQRRGARQFGRKRVVRSLVCSIDFRKKQSGNQGSRLPTLSVGRYLQRGRS